MRAAGAALSMEARPTSLNARRTTSRLGQRISESPRVRAQRHEWRGDLVLVASSNSLTPGGEMQPGHEQEGSQSLRHFAAALSNRVIAWLETRASAPDPSSPAW